MPDRKPYVPPRIQPLTPTLVGKHLAAEIHPGQELEQFYDARELLARHGSPLFVISEERLRNHYRNFAECFSESDLETKVAYSYKTNYLPAVCSLLHEEGAWAEVVSGMEYQLAKALGCPASEIIFNGPYKTREELETALGEGALVNIDGFDELETVVEVARDLGRRARVGLRVNFRYGPAPWTKFGFNYENGDARRAMERIAASTGIDLELLHNHGGTFLVDPKVYREAARVLLDLVREARELDLRPRMLDFGGGFPSQNRLKPAYDVPGGSQHMEGDMLFPFSEAVCGPVSRAADLFDGPPVVVLEPGRALVDSAMQLACTVVAKKEIPGQGPAVIVDAGVNLVPTAYWYDHWVEAGGGGVDGDAESRRVNIYGPLCMQIDVLRERVPLPPMEIGDPLVINNVGAYCLTQSMQFIQPRPAVVLVGEGGEDVIRRRETWRDIFALDTIPPRLRRGGCEF